MPRRRSASPRPSAPVRSMRSSPPRNSNVPMQHAAAPQAGAAAAQRNPGLMGQMAATAGGVAIGSALGHAIGGMFSGPGSQEGQMQQAESQREISANQSGNYGQHQQQQQMYSKPCEFEWQQFLQCTQNQSDLGVCQSFNEIFKECRSRYGGSQN